MLEQLQAQRATLQSFLDSQRQVLQADLSPGLRISLGIYTHILEDGIQILNSLIAYLISKQ